MTRGERQLPASPAARRSLACDRSVAGVLASPISGIDSLPAAGVQAPRAFLTILAQVERLANRTPAGVRCREPVYELPRASADHMADDTDKPNEAAADEAPARSLAGRIAHAPAALVQWASSGRGPMAISAAIGLSLLAIMFGVWSYLAHLAVTPTRVLNINDALFSLDAGDLEGAKAIIGDLQSDEADSKLLGGALFVLGAVKAGDADAEYSVERRRAAHLVASRYLQKASALGFPAGRNLQGRYYLGRSLVLGNQLQAGIDVLEKVLEHPEAPAIEIHSLLAAAQLDSPNPDLNSALRHNEAVLTHTDIPEPQRERAQLQRIEILLRMGRVSEAAESIATLSDEIQAQPHVQLLLGRIEYRAAVDEADPARRQEQLNAAIGRMRQTKRLVPQGSPLTRRATYWIGRAYEAGGDQRAAYEQFDRLAKQHGETSEGIAATLAEANYELADGKSDRALTMFRRVLEGVGDPLTYTNPLLSLTELRKALLAAYQLYLSEQRFSDALLLVDHLEPVFSHVEKVELRAETNQLWGDALLIQASEGDRWRAEETRVAGRLRLRTAGQGFEELSRIRFATQQFTEDLWAAAEAFFAGQSYTNAARLYKSYLHHEARLRNSKALLRLGQSRLAANQPQAAIEAFEECIEMFPRDAVIYTARLDAARAYQLVGDSKAAERLLRTNITGESLKPGASEWRDSLFELGQMYYHLNRFEESIEALDEAVRRYPDAEQSLLAQYTIARAYHSAAEDPLQRMHASKTETDRQKHRRLANQHLDQAYDAYLAVQRMITLNGHGEADPLQRTILRNCYMMQGSVLYDMNRFEEARQAYSNVSGLFQHEPFVMESFLKIANCWRRLNEPAKARGTIEQAKLALQRLPADADFRVATNFSRQQWTTMLDQMSDW